MADLGEGQVTPMPRGFDSGAPDPVLKRILNGHIQPYKTVRRNFDEEEAANLSNPYEYGSDPEMED
jgi:hypothetical protein